MSQLHALLLELIPGGAKKDLSAAQARRLLAGVRPRNVVGKTANAWPWNDRLRVGISGRRVWRLLDLVKPSRGSNAATAGRVEGPW